MNSKSKMKSALVTLIALGLLAGIPTTLRADLDDLLQSVDKANDFAVKHGIVDAKSSCCVNAGDANHDGLPSVADVVFLINYIFMGGPPPPCPNEADINGDCKINIGDAVALIRPIFTFAPWPNCAPDNCQY